jgi:ubiquinone/menaquinone biosynthesis C-methylase UbiE
MADHVCPMWVGYLLLSPLRKWIENPQKLLGPFVRPGMTVLEPGCAMGYFTLPLARMVGPEGRVIAVDIQPGMLAVLSRRARKAGLDGRIETREARTDTLGIGDLEDAVDFAAAIHVVHEMPVQDRFFKEVRRTLKPDGRLLVTEPKGHVSLEKFSQMTTVAEGAGFDRVDEFSDAAKRKLLLARSSAETAP